MDSTCEKKDGIPTFNKKDFKFWNFRIKILLQKEDLFWIVTDLVPGNEQRNAERMSKRYTNA